MTPEEAIEYIQGHNTISDDIKDMAISALEKQILKKPEKYTTESDIYFYICPECEHYVDEETYHCEFCGQALDWSGYDDGSR